MPARPGVFVFPTFGKSRNISLTAEDIGLVIEKLRASARLHATITKETNDDSTFWGEACQHLGINNVSLNRKRLKSAFNRHKKKMTIQKTPQKDPVLPLSDVQATTSPAETPEFHCTSPPNDYTSSSSSSSSSSPDEKEYEEQYFTHKLPDQPCFFFILENDWKKLRKTQHKRQFKTLDWTSIIARGIRTIHPHCSFAFKHHTVQTIGSTRSSALFSCNGYCLFDDCPVTVTVNVSDESSLKASVTFGGDRVWHHCEQLKRRPVRASERDGIADALTNKLPRSLYLENLDKLEESVVASGCRDQVPTTGVMKNITCNSRKKRRRHKNEMMSLQIMLEEEKESEDAIIQKIIMHPKGVMLWSEKTLNLFYERCKDDIVYLDATGSIIHKAKGQTAPFYIYEIVVRHPFKGSSPVPVATYVTSDHTTASVSYFLGAFVTDLCRLHGRGVKKRPSMLVCDGSIVLLQSLSYNFCRLSLQELLCRYYDIVVGQAQEDSTGIPILHRCLSHVMKNAKDLCRKHASGHYHLAMHVFGLMTQATTLKGLDEVLISAAWVFSSSHSGTNVEKHFQNLQQLLTKTSHCDIDDPNIVEQDFVNDVGPTPFQEHFGEILQQQEFEKNGDPNAYFSPTFIPQLLKYFLPQAALWSGLLLGDLGRHGEGPVYDQLSRMFKRAACKPTQNYTQDNKTQGIMEKSQWDLKKIRFQRRKLTRLDDFVYTYKTTVNALLREYSDSLKKKKKKKTHLVDVERWKQRKQNKRGVYVSPLSKPFAFKKHNKKSTQIKIAQNNAIQDEAVKGVSTSSQDHAPSQNPTEDNKDAQGGINETTDNATSQLMELWKKSDTEVVVSVIPSQIIGNSFIIHHSELRTLQPHNWLAGEVIECLLHQTVNELHLGSSIYVLNHYTAGVMLFGKRDLVKRNSLSKINFDNYEAVVSFVNIQNTHWKFLYINAAQSTVYLVDPIPTSAEIADSNRAAKKWSEYLKTRKILHSISDWEDVQWKGGVMRHPVQQDQNSCGLVVFLMAKKVMEAFPTIPNMDFDTTTKEMSHQRQQLALKILKGSVFDSESNCSMCAAKKPPGPGPALTNWIQCDNCVRWFHSQCLQMGYRTLKNAEKSIWNCCLCL